MLTHSTFALEEDTAYSKQQFAKTKGAAPYFVNATAEVVKHFTLRDHSVIDRWFPILLNHETSPQTDSEQGLKSSGTYAKGLQLQVGSRINWLIFRQGM